MHLDAIQTILVDMNTKRANWLFFITILFSASVSILLSLMMLAGFTLPFVANMLVSELLLVLPALSFCLCTGEKAGAVLPFHRIRISTVFMILLYTVLVIPMTIFLNALSMLFVDNTVLEMSGDFLKWPVWVTILLVGVFGPFCEECVFRGVFLQSYRKSGRILGAMLLSSFLFGLMHLNFNQASYAIVIGFMLAMLTEATGSLWSSFLCHALFNTENVVMMYLEEKYAPELLKQTQDMSDAAYHQMLLQQIGIYGIFAAVCTFLAVLLVFKIAKHEGKDRLFRDIWKRSRRKNTAENKGKNRNRFISIPLILGILVSVIFMILTV